MGSLPTADGTSATAKAGCLIVLDATGKAVETLSGRHINGPWDVIAWEGRGFAVLFVSNVRNGMLAASPNMVDRGTVVRLVLVGINGERPRVVSSTLIGSGFPERTDPNALVIGPTGVAPGDDGASFVADTVGNRIAVIPNAFSRSESDGAGRTVSSSGALNGPNGDLIFSDHHRHGNRSLVDGPKKILSGWFGWFFTSWAAGTPAHWSTPGMTKNCAAGR